MYDVRGIQDYIFRTNKIKEIIGASAIVENLIIHLFKDTCNELCLHVQTELESEKLQFSFNENTGFDAEILYYGGGNLLVLFKSREQGDLVSKKMRIALIKKTYSLQLAVARVNVHGQDTFKQDYIELRKEIDRVKSQMPICQPMFSFPITSNDPTTGFPFSKIYNGKKVTYETYYKLKSFESLKIKGKKYEKFGKHENDSLIAIVHIDGNNMGNYIYEKTKDVKTYQDAAKVYRKKSQHIQTVFIDIALKTVENQIPELCKKHDISDNNVQFRKIIHAGDDITFICHAKLALDCVKIFMNILEKNKNFTACAGIYVTHAHFPFSRGYELAEELCSNAKKISREVKGNYVDFHINTSGILNDIAYIRKIHYVNFQNQSLYARPYAIGKNENNNITKLINILSQLKSSFIARNQLKNLREAFYQGEVVINEELLRINSRLDDDKKLYYHDKEYKILFDAVEILDLEWGDSNE